MKIYIAVIPLIILFAFMIVFQIDNNTYAQSADRYKSVANNAADAAALYYDQELFLEGVKVFNKASGNTAANEILRAGLGLNEALMGGITNYAKGLHTYYIYYFDGDGTLTSYHEDVQTGVENVTYPYLFTELQTGYTTQVKEPTVIVTVDAGSFDYRLGFITDPKLIRTSGYEYVGY